MNYFLAPLLQNAPGTPLSTVQRSVEDPIGTQRRLLRSLLNQAAHTEWGARYNFADLAHRGDSVEAFQDRVPLHDYDDIRSDVNRMRRGETDILWPGHIRTFAVSSGTASSGKIIPVSEEMLDELHQFSLAAAMNYIAETGNTSMLLGKHLTLPGRIEEDPEYPGTVVGEVSGLLAEHADNILHSTWQAIDNEIAFIENWDEKLRTIVDETVDMDVRMVVMAPTWGVTLFKLLIDRYNEKYSASVSTVGEIWPNLSLFISGGVALSSYRDLLADLIGLPGLDFIETYGASEGFISFQSDVNDPSMLLQLDNGVFFEFVPVSDLNSDDPRRHTIADVEPDVAYAPYLTTCSGLWAYRLGDVIRFDSVEPPKIRVVGRTSEMIDKYGEAVFGEEARAAVRQACEKTGGQMIEFHVAPKNPSGNGVPSHEWLIEFEPPVPDTRKFAEELDRYLQEHNRHYQIRRQAQAFDIPDVRALQPGTFHAWLTKSRDRVSGQTKVPRMSEEREIADGVLGVAEGQK